MKNSLEIIQVPDGRFILIDGYDTIRKGCNVIHLRNHSIKKVIPMDVVKVDGTKSESTIIGYIGHGGASFLYFRPEVHRRFVKFITTSDLKKIVPTRKYKQNWSKPHTTI